MKAHEVLSSEALSVECSYGTYRERNEDKGDKVS